MGVVAEILAPSTRNPQSCFPVEGEFFKWDLNYESFEVVRGCTQAVGGGRLPAWVGYVVILPGATVVGGGYPSAKFVFVHGLSWELTMCTTRTNLESLPRLTRRLSVRGVAMNGNATSAVLDKVTLHRRGRVGLGTERWMVYIDILLQQKSDCAGQEKIRRWFRCRC